MNTKTKLILEDGTVFEGQRAGAPKSCAGEVVFATGMVGYDLSLTDPSYAGQILTFCYPLIGNWGVPPKHFWESDKIQVAGVVISDLTTHPSHWQSQKTLDAWLKEEGIPAITNIDTRRLTQKLRERGVMLGKIVVDDQDVDFWDPNLTNLVAQVSPKEVKIYHPESLDRHSERSEESQSEGTRFFGFQPQNDKKKSSNSLKIGLLNCGAKKNILRNLLARGATVYELPWNFDPFQADSFTSGVGSSRRFTLKGFDSPGVGQSDKTKMIINLVHDRLTTLADFDKYASIFFEKGNQPLPPKAKIANAQKAIESISDWNEASIARTLDRKSVV